MKQLLQSFRTGSVTVAEVPVPRLEAGQVLVQVAASLISAGTERHIMDFANKSLLKKARARPDLVGQVINKARQEGLRSTLKSVRHRLDQPLPLGYSNAGTVLAVGEGISDIRPGVRVACAGGSYAVHAEVVSVPRKLVVLLPDNVEFESAAFTTLGAVAQHGLRLADVKLGELACVIGLGLLGQLTMQLLKAAGCTVVGMDIDPGRCQLARKLGADAVATTAEGVTSVINRLSSGHGADAVLIAADTPSNQPIELAGQIARERGVVAAMGTVGMQVPRKIYYEKELVLRISRSYGPGRYDPTYEEKGHDYPIAYVRWTENRNMQAFVQLLAEGKVHVKPLITHRFPIEQAPEAYDLITGKTGEPFLGVLVTCLDQPDPSRRIALTAVSPQESGKVRQPTTRNPEPAIRIGLLGAGNFATATLLPAMKKASDLEFIGVCTATGLSARHAGDKFGFRYCTTDESEIISDSDINTVVITTRHHLHARQVIAALNARKHVFCEKPLCLNKQELTEIVQTYKAMTVDRRSQTADNAPSYVPSCPSPVLMVGYNRRFAPMARQLKAFLAEMHEPSIMNYRVNAGYIPLDHWVHDPEQGGGRIIGEVCHFVDFLTFLAGALPTRVSARALPSNGRYQDDNLVVTIEFANGSLGAITYMANGDKAFPKERVEVFGDGAVAVLDDFRRLELIRNGRKKVYKSRLRQDKGHHGEWEAFVAAVRGVRSPAIPFEDIVATTLTTSVIVESLREGMPGLINYGEFREQV